MGTGFRLIEYFDEVVGLFFVIEALPDDGLVPGHIFLDQHG